MKPELTPVKAAKIRIESIAIGVTAVGIMGMAIHEFLIGDGWLGSITVLAAAFVVAAPALFGSDE